MIPILGSTLDAIYERQRSLVRVGALKLDGRGRGGGVKATPKNVAFLVIAMLVSDSPRDAGKRAKKIASTKPDAGVDQFNDGACFLETITKIIDGAIDDYTQYPTEIAVSYNIAYATIEWPTTRARQPTIKVIYSLDNADLHTGIGHFATLDGGALVAINRELWKMSKGIEP